MNKKWLKIFGVFAFIKGAVFLYIVYSGMTGNVVVESLGGGNQTSFIGLILVFVGIGLFISGRDVK